MNNKILGVLGKIVLAAAVGAASVFGQYKMKETLDKQKKKKAAKLVDRKSDTPIEDMEEVEIIN